MNFLSVVAASLLLGAAGLQFVDPDIPEAVDLPATSVTVHIPEPSTLALAALGLAGIAAIRRRRK